MSLRSKSGKERSFRSRGKQKRDPMLKNLKSSPTKLLSRVPLLNNLTETSRKLSTLFRGESETTTTSTREETSC